MQQQPLRPCHENDRKMGRFSGGGKKEIMELKVFPNFQRSSSGRQDEEITSSSARRGFRMDISKNFVMERVVRNWHRLPGWSQIPGIAQKMCGFGTSGRGSVVTVVGLEDLKGFFQP